MFFPQCKQPEGCRLVPVLVLKAFGRTRLLATPSTPSNRLVTGDVASTAQGLHRIKTYSPALGRFLFFARRRLTASARCCWASQDPAAGFSFRAARCSAARFRARSKAVSRGFDCVPRTWITRGLNCKREEDVVVVRDDRTIGLGETRLPPQLSPRPSDIADTSSRSQKNDVPVRDICSSQIRGWR